MSKFLTVIEENLPLTDIDTKTEAKRELQRLLLSKNINSTAKVFRDELSIVLPNGKVVELEIKSVALPKQEEQEDQVTPKVVKALASLKNDAEYDPRFVAAKQKMIGAAQKVADKFSTTVDKI